MKKVLIIFPLIVAFIWSCSNDSDSINDEITFANSSFKKANDNSVFTTFNVTIDNLGGIEDYPNVLSPGTYIVQKKNSAPLFMAGEEDYGEGLEAIAEDGVPTMLTANLDGDPKVRSVGAFAVPVGGEGPAPLTPGGSYTFDITAKPGDYLNFATMFVQSNDLFIAPDASGILLFTNDKTPISGDITMYLSLWDAGTEVNEEPGVGTNQAPRQSGPNVGEDENGVVRLVDDIYTYPNLTDIIKVTITPMS